MKTSKDSLIVQKEDVFVDACLVSRHFPADEVGPAHKKHAYHMSDGIAISYGWTKTEAFSNLIAVASERGWVVLQRLN